MALLGLALAALGSLCAALGAHQQRRARLARQALSRSTVWGSGLLLVVASAALEVCALAFAAQSALAALLALGLLFNLALAPLFGLRAPRAPQRRRAALVAAAAALAAACGEQAAPGLSHAQLQALFARPTARAFLGAGAAVAVVLWVAAFSTARARFHEPAAHVHAQAAAALAGLVGGLGTVGARAAAALFMGPAGAGGLARLAGVVALAGFTVALSLQARALTAALSRRDAVAVAPAFFCLASGTSAAAGAVCFRELEGLPGWRVALYAAGMLGAGAGVALLARDRSSGTSTAFALFLEQTPQHGVVDVLVELGAPESALIRRVRRSGDSGCSVSGGSGGAGGSGDDDDEEEEEELLDLSGLEAPRTPPRRSLAAPPTLERVDSCDSDVTRDVGLPLCEEDTMDSPGRPFRQRAFTFSDWGAPPAGAQQPALQPVRTGSL